MDMAENRRPRRNCAARKTAAPSAVHYVGYVEDNETPEMIMKKFEELEKARKLSCPFEHIKMIYMSNLMLIAISTSAIILHTLHRLHLQCHGLHITAVSNEQIRCSRVRPLSNRPSALASEEIAELRICKAWIGLGHSRMRLPGSSCSLCSGHLRKWGSWDRRIGGRGGS